MLREGVMVAVILWNARKHMWNGHQKSCPATHPGQPTHETEYTCLWQKGVRKVPIPLPSFVWYVSNSHMVQPESANIKQLHLLKSHNSLHDHVQFIVTTMFMLKHVFEGSEKAKCATKRNLFSYNWSSCFQVALMCLWC